MRRRAWMTLCSPLLFLVSGACAQQNPHVEGKNIRIEFNAALHSRIVAKFDGDEVVLGPFTPSEFVTLGEKAVKDFTLTAYRREPVSDAFGAGERSVLTGAVSSLQKTIVATAYDDFPRTVFFDVQYMNRGDSELQVLGWTNHHYAVSAMAAAEGEDPAFWSYQSGSYRDRRDWVLPLTHNFRQENFLGMNASDYGGGTPVVDVWRKDVGIGVGHIERVPKLVSLPVAMPDAESSNLAITFETRQTLKPGATLTTLRTFVTVHQGDYFQTLTDYRRVMEKQGFEFQAAPESAFGPVWCAWGYGKEFTPAQIYEALPTVKKLGFSWVQTDDGWETFLGDGELNRTKFPNGDQDMRALVDRYHADGFRAQLWWAPLTAHPESDVVKKHPERLLLNADGSKQRVSYWDSWYMCPADPAVIEHHRQLVTKIIRDWGYDGLKLDGQHMNGVPPCYNPAHNHRRPEESVEARAQFFKMIFDTARSIKPDAVIEWCPCGTSFNFFTLPYISMSVASDPRSSFQVRSKGKTLKALHGDGIAYFGDHVELSTGRDDFASTVGVGGIVGSNFTWPPGSGPRARQDLTPEKEKHYAKWIQIYKDKMLSRGEYQGNLYDIGFDRPETHAIRKGPNMYYAFYAPEWKGQVELRGLEDQSYRVTDYVNGVDLATVHGPVGRLDVQFRKHLLLEATPE